MLNQLNMPVKLQTAPRPQSWGKPVGPIYTWWRGDPLPLLAPLPGFDARPCADEYLIAELAGIPVGDVRARVEALHYPYVVYLMDKPVSYGWVATRTASIGELGINFRLPPEHRYLWDFATLPDWRGRGIYPHLLQAILRHEQTRARCFWIGHEFGNVASGRGICKAGLQLAGQVYRQDDDRLVLVGGTLTERARAAASVFAITMIASNDGAAEHS